LLFWITIGRLLILYWIRTILTEELTGVIS